MIKAYELTSLNADVLKKFGLEYNPLYRYFGGFEENECFSVSSMTYNKGVFIESILLSKNASPNYYDLMARFTLKLAADMPNQRVYLKSSDNDEYFYKFGLKKNGGFLEAESGEIVFPSCCGKCKK